MYQVVSKEIVFEAAHRLVNGYPGNCRHVHGHSWKAVVVVKLKSEADLNKFGFVKDFGDFKKLKDWVMDNWDHAALFSENDRAWQAWLVDNDQRRFAFPVNPSSEIVARALCDIAIKILNDDRCEVIEVRINETCTSETVFRP